MKIGGAIGHFPSLIFLLIYTVHCDSSVWNWTVNETVCSVDDSQHNILYIRVDRNSSSFSATCFAFQNQDHGATSCEHNKFDVTVHRELLPDRVHIICGCSGKPGLVCYNKLREHGDSSFFCLAGTKNVSLCGPGQLCGGLKSGCVNTTSCKNTTDYCVNDDGNDSADCCCSGSFCNGWFEEDKIPTHTPFPPPSGIPGVVILISVIVSVAILSMVCLTMWLLYRFKKRKKLPQPRQPQSDINEIPLLSERSTEEEPSKEIPPPVNFSAIEKLEVLSRGQRGTRSVYTAKCDSEIYAVKYFLLNDYSSWDAELKIYFLPHMQHENLLKFIGYTAGGIGTDGSPTDHAIFTEYMPAGSLQDVLKQREVTWDELLHIASDMMCGLAYLHSAIPSSDPKNVKPPIAHRDFKSRNVLMREDLTACVADFGLALPFDSARRTSNCGQVGTLRYMAPEVLDLAVNFSCDAFLRIDVYACGLTLWELLRRCSKPPELQASPVYEQPFETQLNKYYPQCHNHPTPSEMQDIVFVRRLRPDLPSSATASQNLYDLIVTIEQCWDHDSEARPSAGCVYNRLKRIREQCVRSVSSGENLIHMDVPKKNGNATESRRIAAQNGDKKIEHIELHELHNQPNGTSSSHQPPLPHLLDLSVNIVRNGDTKLNGGPKVFEGVVA